MKNWYTLYYTSNGRRFSTGSTEPTEYDAELSLISHGEVEQPDQVGRWNESTLEFDPIPPVRKISVSEFLLRMTEAERALYYNLDNKNGRTVEKAIASAERIGYVDLDSPSVGGMLDILVADSVITAGRKTEILT